MKILNDNYYCRVLNSNDSISKAFELLNGDFGMIVSIIDKKKNFLGIVTEGDLRRNLLNGISIDDKLVKVLNTKPLKVRIDKSGKKIIEKNNNNEYSSYNSFLIPVIDYNNKIIGVIEFNELNNILNKKKFSNLIRSPHVLIIGGGGYIGSVLTGLVLKKKWRVKVVDNFLYDNSSLDRFKNNPNFSLINKDICDINVQVDSIKDIDCVVFLAEIVGDPSCNLLPQDAIKTNYLAVSSMANLCSYTNINRFIYTSSCSVYGASKNVNSPLDENSPLNPVSHYARIKSSSEQALLSILNNNFNPTILRLATVFGPSFRQRFDLVVNTFARNAFLKRKIIVHGGSQWRPNVHVVDVANSIIKVIESPINKVGKQIFNICNEKENNTISNIANIINKIFPNSEIEYLNTNNDIRNYKVSSKKILEQINFSAKFSMEEGLIELLEYFKKNKINNFEDIKYSNIDTHLNRIF